MTLTFAFVETLRRKLVRSLSQRGLWPTLKRCAARPSQILLNIARSQLPQERRFRRQEREFDVRYHVDTRADRDPGWMAAIASPNWMHGIGYAPVPYADLREVLARLNLSWESYTFVDLGAGKGRALLVAAEFPFQHIAGIEYSPRLAATMRNNISAFRNPQQRCWSLESVLGDATEYTFPTSPLVVFFHHPFEAPVFRQVLKRLEASLISHPRHALAIYYDPKCEEVLAQSASFRRIREGRVQAGLRQTKWVVYEAISATETGS